MKLGTVNLRSISSAILSSGPVYSLSLGILKRAVVKEGSLNHVAIIQDGNRRYARMKNIPSQSGHFLGSKTTDRVADWCIDLGIKHLTVYTFSTENFNRPEDEKRYLFELIRDKLAELCVSRRVHKNKVRVRAIGRTEQFPHDLQEAIREVEKLTCDYDGMYFNLALGYGGQREMLDAARDLAVKVREGVIRPEEVDEMLIARHLYPQDGVALPDVNLLIRTGGDYRTSNFLPWQTNGNECPFYICARYWPEFGEIDFLRAIRAAQLGKLQSHLRFGFGCAKSPGLDL